MEGRRVHGRPPRFVVGNLGNLGDVQDTGNVGNAENTVRGHSLRRKAGPPVGQGRSLPRDRGTAIIPQGRSGEVVAQPGESGLACGLSPGGPDLAVRAPPIGHGPRHGTSSGRQFRSSLTGMHHRP
ncbi:hypothetical protein GCM10017559_10830 [Streptosporangium longisporum]|uniref:Uncharacterized protein n=1 Tax=Streptosporangium longisporum TaxID=46187 RepID=A0ABN3XSC0_9ACTN